GFLNRWPIWSGGEASGTGASRTSTKASGSTRATFTYSPSTRLPISTIVVYPKHCESLIRFSILRRTILIPSGTRRVLHKPRATCRGLLHFSLRSAQVPTPTRSEERRVGKEV